MRTVIHEMRNHLAVAVANVEAFIDGKLEPSTARLTAVLQALNEIDVLLNDLRPYAAQKPAEEPHKLEVHAQKVDICGVITNELLGLEAFAKEHGIDYSVGRCDEIASGCARFIGDPRRVSEIVTNVVGNAIRYTQRGGHIYVDCHRVAGQLQLTVMDDGPGIAADELARIFERGYRSSATAQVPGSGLGLALVQEFVGEHGGSVEVESEPGRGATFTIRLPGIVDAGGDCQTCGGHHI